VTNIDRGRGAWLVVLAFVVLCLPYTYRLGDVPLVKVDEMWGAQPSWEIWTHGRFALPAFKGQLHQDVATFFHPPGYYIVNAPFMGVLRRRRGACASRPRCSLCSHSSCSTACSAACSATTRAPRRSRSPASRSGVESAHIRALASWAARDVDPVPRDLRIALLLRDPAAAPRGTAGDRRHSWPAFAAGVLSGYAFFSHYWAWVLPGAVAVFLLQRRAWRSLALYAAGTAVFVAVTAAWILTNRADFTAELLWHRSSYLTHSTGGYLAKRLADHLVILRDARATCTWWLEAVLVALLALPGARALRCANARAARDRSPARAPVPAPQRVLHDRDRMVQRGRNRGGGRAAWRASSAGVWTRRTIAVGLAVAIAVPAALLGYMIWRDRDASYAAAFQPLREAVDRADPSRTGVTVGSEIQYFAFWDRPFLVRWNPYLWRDVPSQDPDSLIRRWRAIGVRFVLTSSFMPTATPLGPFERGADRALVDRLRERGRLLAQAPTWFYWRTGAQVRARHGGSDRHRGSPLTH
jgi:hypothetical protein